MEKLYILDNRFNEPVDSPEHDAILNTIYDHQTDNKKNRLLKKITISTLVGIVAISSLLVGGDYLAKRFGEEAGNAAFSAMNTQAQKAINNLENQAPDIIAKHVLPSAVCVFAKEHKISQKILNKQKIHCTNNLGN
jgi:hypothetical protein